MKVQSENLTRTAVIAFAGLRMFVVMIKQLVQSLPIFIMFIFGGEGLVIAIDGLVNVFNVLAFIDDVEGSETGVVVRDNVELALVLALAQFFVAINEESGEVEDVVVLCKLAQFEAGVLEEIFIVDVLIDQGSLDFGLVSEVESFKYFGVHIDWGFNGFT